MTLTTRRSVVLGVITASALVACGRVDYGNLPVELVEVESQGETILPPGGSVVVHLQASPAPFPWGTYVDLHLELGVLRYGDHQDTHMRVYVEQDGTIAPVTVIIPLDVAPGRILTLTASVPLAGDVEYEVREPAVVPLVVGAHGYEVHEGFVVDAPLAVDSAVLAGRAEQLAMPVEGSAFGDTVLYVGLSAPPAVLRATADGLEPFALIDDPARAADRLTAITFPRPDKGYGDNVYLCTSNDDGILALDAEGGSVEPVLRGACSGLVFDHATRLDYDVSFESPLYFTDPAGRIGRVDPQGVLQNLGEGLPAAEGGVRLRVCPKDFLEATTVLLSSGAAGLGTDGSVWHIARLAPFATPTIWLDGLSEPEDAAFSDEAPWGWLAFFALAESDEIIAVRRDGTTLRLLAGIDEPAGLLRVGSELWVLGRGRGELIRIRAASAIAVEDAP